MVGEPMTEPQRDPDHVCDLVVADEGEAVCFECGAYYIYRSTLSPVDREEWHREWLEAH